MHSRKILVLSVLYIIFLIGCKETVTNNTPGQNNSFSIPVWDYSDYHYFIDTLYKTSFLVVMNDSTGIIPQSVLNNKIRTDLPSFQVWVQCDNTVSLKRIANA